MPHSRVWIEDEDYHYMQYVLQGLWQRSAVVRSRQRRHTLQNVRHALPVENARGVWVQVSHAAQGNRIVAGI